MKRCKAVEAASSWLVRLEGQRSMRGASCWNRAGRLLATVALMLPGMWTGSTAQAEPMVGAHLEVGFGRDVVRSLDVESTPAFMASLGVNLRTVDALRIALEGIITGGSEGPVAHFEGSLPGSRTLWTLLGGIELTKRSSLGAPYAFLGAGIGRNEVRGANNGFPPFWGTGRPVPGDLTAMACGGGLGYRFSGGPGVTGWQVGLRTHGLLQSGKFVTWASCVTLGIAL